MMFVVKFFENRYKFAVFKLLEKVDDFVLKNQILLFVFADISGL